MIHQVEKDLEHLEWIYNRMINIHKEDPKVDYMRAMRRCIDGYESEWKRRMEAESATIARKFFRSTNGKR